MASDCRIFLKFKVIFWGNVALVKFCGLKYIAHLLLKEQCHEIVEHRFFILKNSAWAPFE